ncbi:MAG TPA: replication-associated recombination protein A [Halanaerobiales bacterium]|nr:replication-associated recombination protein A [Halanaerobiales bacterium]
MPNLFENDKNNDNHQQPLAYRMRPKSLDDIYGQADILGENKILRRAIEADQIQSLILYGPPGTGKTSIASVIAENTDSDFKVLNAVTSGVGDIRDIIKEAKEKKDLYNTRTILFIDEIHRFNKAQQDALLPAVEKGIVIMIGATTENPYFEVNSPLLSRSRIFQLEPLKKEDIINIINDALNSKMGMADYNIGIDEDTIDFIAKISEGDARVALNTLESAVLTTPVNGEGKILITKDIIREALQKKSLNYDKKGDNHYDNISALIKSMRGSDPDAALFWLAKMIEAGEDPKFIARRIIIHAAEDVGLADPQALLVANAAFEAVTKVGLPEARIPLAEAVIYIASAPKSNTAVKAIDKALDFVRNNPTGTVPVHLRSSNYKGAKDLGRGIEYKYPHNYKNNYVKQNYFPEEIDKQKFFEFSDLGNEKRLRDFLKKLKDKDNEPG